MMENKCNQTPNKYMDHVYCQPTGNTYMRASNNNAGGAGGGSSDFLAMLKENKQLKAMLILHLDLIQEQSDQLIAKDKQIGGLKEELHTERIKSAQLEVQVQELQRQLQRQLKRAAAAPVGELSLLSPPPLAKIQCNKGSSAPTSPTNNIIGECNGKLISKIVLQRGSFPESTHSPNSTTTISDSASEEVVQQKQCVDVYDIEELTTEESNDATTADDKTSKTRISDLPRGAKPRRPLVNTAIKAIPPPTTTPMQVCVTPPTPSRGKQMPLMLWHAPDMHSEDESGSCDSPADGEQLSTPANSPIPAEKTPATVPTTPKNKSRSVKKPSMAARQQQPHKHKRRCTYLTTSLEYPTREWEDEDEKVCDYEFSQAEADAIHAEAPMLEIPKWTEHDLSPSYCIEGTEDLSDDTFLKRHAKLEIDEKRRKKWDVQQIREQRRVEKLKQRHYKNEVQEEQILKSFFPQPDGIQSICYVNELPVQAFGESIPKINLSVEFMLPWLQIEPNTSGGDTTAALNTATQPTAAVEVMANSTASSTSAQAQQQLTKSTFVFLKKRKRQQSSSAAAIAAGTQRQRSLAAAKGGQQQQQQILAAAAASAVVASTTATANKDLIDGGQINSQGDTKTPTEEDK